MRDYNYVWYPFAGSDSATQYDGARSYDGAAEGHLFWEDWLGPALYQEVPLYPISDLYNQYLQARDREWLVKVNIDGTDYGSSVIVDFTIDTSIVSGDDFALGSAILSKLTLTIKTSAVIAANAKVIPYLALTGVSGDTEWLPLGEFYIDNREQINNLWVFTCYDKLVWANVPYISSLTYPTTQQAVWDEICSRLGYTYDSSVVINSAYQIQAGPAGYTMRQVLGYIASANAACVYIDKGGILRFRRFGQSDTPAIALTSSEYIRAKQLNPLKTFTRVEVTYNTEDGLSYVVGSGDANHTLQVENPFATLAITNDLYARLNGFSYTPVSMDARGYPQLEAGDRIRYGEYVGTPAWEDADTAWEDTEYSWDGYISGGETLALHTVYTFRGGLRMSVDAPSKSEQQSEFQVDGSLSGQINKLNTNAVKQGKSYYGMTVTRTEGLTIEREDHASKVILNSDKFAFQVGGVDKIYFDPVSGKYKMEGTLVATDGVFSGSLSAATGTFAGVLSAATGTFAGSLTAATGTFAGSLSAATGTFAGSLSAATGTFSGTLSAASGTFTGTVSAGTITGGTITGASIAGGTVIGATVATAASGSSRVELTSGLADIATYSGSTNVFAVINNGSNVNMFFENLSGINTGLGILRVWGTLDFAYGTPVNFPMSGVTGLSSALSGKANAFSGLSGNVDMHSIGGPLMTFSNGILVGIS